MSVNPFSRDKEGKSTPKQLAKEALDHIRKAAKSADVSPQTLKRQERRAKEAMREKRTPTLPNLDSLLLL